jgi:hypothetical protein
MSKIIWARSTKEEQSRDSMHALMLSIFEQRSISEFFTRKQLGIAGTSLGKKEYLCPKMFRD